MIVGSLLEVMCLDEDWMSVRQNVGSRARNQGRPLGMVAGSQKEILEKAKKNLSPKDYKKFEDSVVSDAMSKVDPYIQQMRQGVKDKRAGKNTDEAKSNWELNQQLKQYARSIGLKRTDPEFPKRLAKDSLNSGIRLPSNIGALALPDQGIIAANSEKNVVKGAINKDSGRIDPNSKPIKHELQHIAQGRANDAVDKYYGLAPGTTSKAYKAQYADVAKLDDPSEEIKYTTDPYEYESNVTGTSSKLKPGVRGSTVRIAKQMIGKGLNPLNPTFGRGEQLNRKLLGTHDNDLDETPNERRRRLDTLLQDRYGQYRHTNDTPQKVTKEMRRKEKEENEKIAATAKQVGQLYDMDGTLKGRKVQRSVNGVRPDQNNSTIMQIRKAQENLKKQQEQLKQQEEQLRAKAVRPQQVQQPTKAALAKFAKPSNAKTYSIQPQPMIQQAPVQQQVVQPVQQVQPQPQQVVQQPVQTVQPRPVVQQTVAPQASQPVQPQPAGTVQPRPYANPYNAQLQQRAIAAGGATNRNTGITYFKKNGKLMSTAMK